MIWARMLAYITGTVDQELLLRNEYLAAENRILRAQIQGRLLLSDSEKATLAEIAHGLGRKALADVAAAAKPDTLLGWPCSGRFEAVVLFGMLSLVAQFVYWSRIVSGLNQEHA